ncbi:MAG TPA: PAS domain S-box protein [Methanospirillum sp.]|uniref:PAS domain S-box protein n=1 Tax=Methanospirillum sp. TaxID=45200 RepID=UPI002BB6B192|nr:PAS domain S-box protein [Methanospirillum sp.]HOJ96965.1 PAS domain S-box protein [Methanospirillum sp.]HPP78252.1 PAS domain S-box protein [Methanospirillum sp.]
MNIQYLRKLTDEIFKADEKQRRYEANFRKFYDTISDLIFILDMDFRIIHVNKSVLNTLKTTLDDIQNVSFLKLIKQEYRNEVTGYLENHDASSVFTATISLPDEDEIYVQGTVDVSDWSGSPALFVVIHNITEHIKYENALELKTAELEAYNQELRVTEDELKNKIDEIEYNFSLFREMCNNVPEMIWAKNVNKEYIFANTGLCRTLLKCEPDEVYGKTDLYFAERERAKHPDDPNWHTFGELCQNSDDVVFKTLKTEYFEESGNVEGKNLILAVYKSPFYYNNELIGIVGTARDITEVREIETQLDIKRNFLDSILKVLPVPIYYRDLSGVYLDCNEAFVNYYGASKSYIIGKTNLQLFPEYVEFLQKKDVELLETGDVQYFECMMYDRDMQLMPVLIVRTLHKLSTGEIRGVIGAVLCINHYKYLTGVSK